MTPGNEAVVSVDSNGKPFNQTKVEQAAMLLVDLHPLLAYDSARRIVENANDLAARPSQPPVDVERVARVKAAVADARLCLARLADYAVVHCVGLTDQSPVIADALKAIAAIDGVFTSSTDAATGLPIAAMQP